MSDIKNLESKMEARFDRLETKLDKFGEKTTEHAEQIKALQGYAKYGLTVFLAVCGFFAAAYFKR